MSKAITNLPFLILSYWLLCLYFIKSEFYKEHYLTLDLLDCIPVCLSIFHFLLNMDLYNRFKTNLIYVVIAGCLVAQYKNAFGSDLYIKLYGAVLIGGISTAVLTYFITSRK